MLGEIRARATFLNSCPRVTASGQLKTCSAELPCKSARCIYKLRFRYRKHFYIVSPFQDAYELSRSIVEISRCTSHSRLDKRGRTIYEITVLRWHGWTVKLLLSALGSLADPKTWRTSLSLYFIQNLGSDAKRARVFP